MEENTDSIEEVNNKNSDKGRNIPIKLDRDQSDSKEIKKDTNKKVLDENKISTKKNIDSKNNLKNTNRPIAGDKCWVINCEIKETCSFWLSFEKEDISSFKIIYLS